MKRIRTISILLVVLFWASVAISGPVFTNNATTTIANVGGITALATSLTVATGTGALFPATTNTDYFYVTLVDSSRNREVVKVTTRAGDVFTIDRAQEGTSARAWDLGDIVDLRLTAGTIQKFQNAMPGWKYVDPDAADQGVAGTNTLKTLIDAAGANTETIVLKRHDYSTRTAYTLTTDETIPSNITLMVESGAYLTGAGNLTIQGPVDAGSYEIFDLAGTITYSSVTPPYLIWFDGGLSEAATSIGTTNATTLIIDQSIAVPATLDLSTYTNITFKIVQGGMLAPAAGQTLTLPSRANVVVAPGRAWITGSGTVAVGTKDGLGYPEDFATVDGTADEVQINLALTAWGNVELLSSYTIAAPFLVHSGDTLKGQGMGRTIIYLADNAASANMLNLYDASGVGDATGITIRDMTFNGNKANQTATEDMFYWESGKYANVKRSRVENIQIVGAKGGGFRFGDGNDSVGKNLHAYNGDSYGFKIGVSDWHLTDIVAGLNAGPGLTIGNASVQVTNGKFWQNGFGGADDGIYISSANSGVILSGCRVEDNSRDGLRLADAQRVIVQGLIADSNDERGIRIMGGIDNMIDAIVIDRAGGAFTHSAAVGFELGAASAVPVRNTVRLVTPLSVPIAGGYGGNSLEINGNQSIGGSFVYDFSVSGGAQGSINLGLIPINSIITRAWYRVVTPFTSGGAALVSFGVATNDATGLKAATAFDHADYGAGNHDFDPDGTAANFTTQTTASRQIIMTIADADLTAGKVRVWFEYIIAD